MAHGFALLFDGAVGLFEAVEDFGVVGELGVEGIDGLDLEESAGRHSLHAPHQFEVRFLRPGHIAEGIGQPGHGHLYPKRIEQGKRGGQQAHGHGRGHGANGGTMVERIVEIQVLGSCGRGSDDRPTQSGRAGLGVVFRLVEKLHRAGQTVAEQGKGSFDALGQTYGSELLAPLL